MIEGSGSAIVAKNAVKKTTPTMTMTREKEEFKSS
jgi:hypothetical protein